MLSALALVTLQQWRLHKLRLALTILGVALGVAVFFAARTTSLSVQASAKRTIERIAGKATLQVTAGESGFPEQVLETVRSTSGVEVAEPVIEVLVRTALNDGGDVLVVGVDATGDQRIREYLVDESQSDLENPLAFVTREYSIAISRALADRYHLRIADKFKLHTPQGVKEFTVRGIFKPTGIGEVFGGQVAVMDVYAAQIVFNRGGNFDRIDLISDPALSIETVQQQLRARLPPGLQVSRPSMRERSMDNWVAAVNLGQQIMSYLALTVGVFLIFNSFATSVNQRWKEIGILRAVGVERRNIQRMFLGEAVMVGVIGSVIGIAGGYYLASVAGHLVAGAAVAFGQLSEVTRPIFRLDYALWSFAIGIVSSVLAAWLPARASARVNVALSLHNIESRGREGLLGWRPVVIGLMMIGTGLALVRFATLGVGSLIQFTYAAMMMIGFIFLLPQLIELFARALRPLMTRLFGSEGTLAVDAMASAPRRSSATVGAVMVGLSFVFSNGAAVQSHYDAILNSIDRTLRTADLLVTASAQFRSLTYRFDEEFGKRIAEIDGVASAESTRSTSAPYGGDNVALVACDSDAWLVRSGDILSEGDYAAVRNLLPKGEGVLLSENFARRWHVGLAERVRLESPAGTLELPVIGILEDYHSDKGTIFMERALYKAYWKDRSVDSVLIKLKPNVDSAAVRRAIQAIAANQQQTFIYTNDEFKRSVIVQIDRFLMLSHIQIVIALLVAAIGMINTLTISVSERRREFGVIRAIGGLRSQTRKMVLLEALALTIVGVATGVASSVSNTYFMVHTAATTIAGASLPFRLPVRMILLSLPVAAIASMAIAWWPARRVANLRITDAIGYE